MNPKVALITGVTGQDGAYLSELLLNKGYEVHGIKRRASSFNTERVDHIYQDRHLENQRFILHYGDLTDPPNPTSILAKVQPDELYNLAAQSHVRIPLIVTDQCKKLKQRRPGVPPGHVPPESPVTINGIRG